MKKWMLRVAIAAVILLLLLLFLDTSAQRISQNVEVTQHYWYHNDSTLFYSEGIANSSDGKYGAYAECIQFDLGGCTRTQMVIASENDSFVGLVTDKHVSRWGWEDHTLIVKTMDTDTGELRAYTVKVLE